MPSNRHATVRLKVTPEDPASEITVTRDSEQIAKDQGPLERDLAPGIYKVTARVGFDFDTKTVLLDGTEREVHVTMPVLEFYSPAPLKNTKTLRAEHARAAKRESRRRHVELGEGSWVFVFARDWRKNAGARTSHLFKGVALRSVDDDVLVDLEARGVAQANPYPWAACSITVNPGAYRLVVDLPSGERLSHTVVATLGWQTQVFLLTDNAEKPRVDLMTAAVLVYRRVLPSSGFDPNDPELRMVEFARYSLPSNAQGLSDYVRERVVAGKALHPMLGIFAAHQLIANSNGDRQIAASIVADLTERGFGGHPDVIALSISLDEKRRAAPFTIPPTLRRSWELLLRTTVRQPDLIPPDSLADKVATRVWGEEPWMVWKEPAAKDVETEINERSADLEERLERELKQLGANWLTDPLSDEWLLKQVSLLGLPRKRLERLVAKIRGAHQDAAPSGRGAGISARALREVIMDGFSDGELQLLRADLEEQLRARGVNIRLSKAALGGEEKEVQVQNLIEALQRHQQLPALVETVRQQRPDLFDDSPE